MKNYVTFIADPTHDSLHKKMDYEDPYWNKILGQWGYLSSQMLQEFYQSDCQFVHYCRQKDNSEVCAICLWQGNGEVWDLVYIFVVQEMQGNGLAPWFLTESLYEIKKRNGQECFLEVSENNPRAISFYLKIGFVKVGQRKRYYKDGSDAWIFKKKL